MAKLVLQKGAQSDDFGTPENVLDVVRRTVGPLLIDLASSKKHDKLVKAVHYYTKSNPCPKYPPNSAPRCSAFCNPPGPVANVRWFWDTWCNWVKHRCGEGAFLIFQIDHWRSLPSPPWGKKVWCTIWPKRLKYISVLIAQRTSAVCLSQRRLRSFPRTCLMRSW